MQNLDNDMDDLFRRAAERYPLHPGRSQWDVIEKKLAVAKGPEMPKKSKGINNFKKLLLLLLLMGISLLIGFMILNLYSNISPVTKTGDQINQPVNKYNNSISRDNGPLSKSSINLKNEKEKISNHDNIKKLTHSGISKEKNKAQVVINLPLEIGKNILEKDQTQAPASFYPKYDRATFQKQDSTQAGNIVSNAETNNETLLPENKNGNDGNKNIPLHRFKKIKPNSKTSNENGFYAGIITGPDFSKVKAGSFKGPGLGLGILTGYTINKSLFIETGITRVSKYYSSDGKSFNEKGAAMPDGMVINNLEGRSKILEIPLKIGYQFYQKKNVNIFLAGGGATYIMTHEKNNYNVTMNGNTEKMEGIYKKNNVKMPAVFNISLGVESRVTGLLKIRIEPYLKLPLQGVGVGKLPVTSAGIHLDLTRRLK